MGIEKVKRIAKIVARWAGVLFFTSGASVCLTEYESPLLAVLWLWTAILVSPLPIKLMELFNLKISERVCNIVMWVFVAASFAGLFMC